MIALLHTSPIHITRFNTILQKLNFTKEVKHYVNESILKNALLNGQPDREGFQLEIERIKHDNPTLIICTCSTYGPECDKFEDVKRIDKPIADYLVEKYTTIGLAYAASSTKKASESLLLTSAKKLNKTIKVVEFDCTGSWKFLEAGDKETYVKDIAHRISSKESKAEAIFLAQASMENAKNHLSHLSKEVVSSPEYGLQQLLEPLK